MCVFFRWGAVVCVIRILVRGGDLVLMGDGFGTGLNLRKLKTTNAHAARGVTVGALPSPSLVLAHALVIAAATAHDPGTATTGGTGGAVTIGVIVDVANNGALGIGNAILAEPTISHPGLPAFGADSHAVMVEVVSAKIAMERTLTVAAAPMIVAVTIAAAILTAAAAILTAVVVMGTVAVATIVEATEEEATVVTPTAVVGMETVEAGTEIVEDTVVEGVTVIAPVGGPSSRLVTGIAKVAEAIILPQRRPATAVGRPSRKLSSYT